MKLPDTDPSKSPPSDESSTMMTSDDVDGPTRASRDSSSACHIATERASEAHVPSTTAIQYRSSDVIPWATTGDRREESEGRGTAAEPKREGQVGTETDLVTVGRCWTGFLLRTAAPMISSRRYSANDHSPFICAILPCASHSGTRTSTLRFFAGCDTSADFSGTFTFNFPFPFDLPFSFKVHPGWKLYPFCSSVHLKHDTWPGQI